jgi:outer membrane protein assembly factor BamB
VLPTTLRLPRACALLASLLVVLGTAAGVAEAGQSSKPAAPMWSQFQGGPEHAGSASAPTAEPPYRRSWTFDEPDSDQGFAAPLIVGNVAVGLGAKAVYGVDLSSGKQVWRVARTGGPNTEPAAGTAGGNVLIVYADGGVNQQPSNLVAIDAETQKQLWSLNLGATSVSGVSIDGSTAFVGDIEGVLHAVDLAKGTSAWTSKGVGRIEAPPAIADGIVYVGSRELQQGNATIRALDESSGEQKWTFSQQQLTSGSAITVSDGRAISGFTDRLARAFNASTGTGEWTALMSNALSPRGAPAAGSGAVYLADLAGTVERVGATDGSRVWSYRFNTVRPLPIPYLDFWSSPVLAGSSVLIGLGDGRLGAVSTTSGHLQWEGDTGPGALGGIALGPGVVVVAKQGANGALIAFRHDASGTLLDEPSPTELDAAKLLGRFAVAFVIVFALAVFGGMLLGRRREETDEPIGAES